MENKLYHISGILQLYEMLTDTISECKVNHMVNKNLLNEIFGALAGEPRRDIIALLQSGPRSMTELATPLDMSLPLLHKHVKVLEQAGLISRRKVGREQRVSLEPSTLSNAQEWIESHRKFWNQQLDDLEVFITRKNGEV